MRKLFTEYELVARTLVDYLLNDLRVTSETHCRKHGRSDSGGPAFTLTMLSLGAADAVGRLTAPKAVFDNAAIREFLYAVGDLAGDQRYRQLAGPLYGIFRHGIVHSFVPKVLTVQGRTVNCRTCWLHDKESRSECFDWMQTDEGKPWVTANRPHHLAVMASKDGSTSTFTIAPQILALDVHAYLDHLKRAIGSRDADVLGRIKGHFPAWMAKANTLDQKRWITAAEEAALFVPNVPGKIRAPRRLQ